MRTSALLFNSVLFGMVLAVAGCSVVGKDGQDRVTVNSELPTSFERTVPLHSMKIAAPSGACNIETIDFGPFGLTPAVVNKLHPVTLAGWAMDKEHKKSASAIYIVLANKAGKPIFLAAVNTRIPRGDVANYFKLPHLLNLGFRGTFSLGGVPAGTYRVLTYIQNRSGFSVCDNGRTIIVRS